MKKIKQLKHFMVALGTALPINTMATAQSGGENGIRHAPQIEVSKHKTSVAVATDTLPLFMKKNDSLGGDDSLFLRNQHNNQLLLDTLAADVENSQIKILQSQNDSLGLKEIDDSVKLVVANSLTNKINKLIQSKTLVTDSAVLDSAWNRLCSIEKKMLQFIAHFEDIRARAYYDPNGKKWTYAMGLTVDERGKPLHSGSRIKSIEHLYQVWGAFVRGGETRCPSKKFVLDNSMFGVMCQALPIAQMTDEQIIASGSFVFNGGFKFLMHAGIEENTKSNYSILMYRYMITGDKQDLDSLLNLHAKVCTARGKTLTALKKRRAVEARCLASDICLVLSETEKDSLPPDLQEKALILNDLTIGASYDLDLTTIQNPEEYLNKVTEVKGDTVETKINKQFYMPVRPTNKKATISSNHQPATIPERRYGRKER